VDPRVAVARLEPLTETLRTTLFLPRAAVGAFAVVAAVGLATALSGTYWLAALTAARRRREFAIRRALGASRWRIVGHHLRRTLGWGATGVCLGLLLAAIGTRSLRSLLYGVEPGDPGAFVSAAVVLSALLLVCILAAVRGGSAESDASILRGD
jgi:ABC-type antimicrobial peptide transport system permease subunit